MALVIEDRVKETTTTTGTGTITLAGAATGFQSFAAIGDGNTTYYAISGGSQWEVGLGTYTASGTTLSRDTVFASSNAGALVSFSAGTKDVICTNPATKAVMAGTGAFTDQFAGDFTTGVVVDYLSGAGRINVGSTDKLQFYSGGVGGTLMGEAFNNGNWDFNGVIKAGVGTSVAGATNPLIEASGAASGYVQIYVHNNTNGTSSSADIAAYPNNGSDTSGYIDMGITSQTYSDAAFGTILANEGYIYMSAPSGSGTTGSLILATDSTGSANDIQFFTNGFNQAKSAVELIIKGITGNIGIKTQNPTAALHLPLGTAAANTAPLKFTSGTVQTTAEAGTAEYDGKVFYGTAEASQRGVMPNEQFVILTTNYTTPAGANNTLKQAFNTTTNGALTVAGNTTYLFECMLNIASMSATSGNLQFGIGGTAIKTRTNYVAIANKQALGVQTASSHTFGTVATAVVITASNTTQTGYAFIRGSLVIGTGGTIIPSIALSVANAAVIQAGSYFKLTPIGSNAVTQIGNWS
jgi:hypothetical protein